MSQKQSVFVVSMGKVYGLWVVGFKKPKNVDFSPIKCFL